LALYKFIYLLTYLVTYNGYMVTSPKGDRSYP